jgi:hypothetical protein
MTLEDELLSLWQEVRPSSQQEQRFLATAANKASRRQRRRRSWRMAVVPLIAVGCMAAAAIGVSSLDWGAHTPAVDHPAVVTVVPTPPPTVRATPTITPLPPLSYQPIPGVSADRAAAIVSRCVSSLRESVYLAPGRATLEDLVENRVGTVVIIDAPLRADAKPPVRPGVPNLSHTLLFVCVLGPDDTVAGLGFGGMLYQDHAIPGPLLVDGSFGSSAGNPNSNTPHLEVIHGRVARNVARVVWDTPDGQHVSAEIRNGYFLTDATDVSDGTGQSDLRAYDQAGHELTITGPDPTLSGAPATTYWP